MEYMEAKMQDRIEAGILERAEMDMLIQTLKIISRRPTHEGGCYYNNRHSINEAREALKAVGVDWLAD